jgi:hypothetical protein
MRDRPKGQALKVYHIGTKRTSVFALKKVYGIVVIGFVGDFALEIKLTSHH